MHRGSILLLIFLVGAGAHSDAQEVADPRADQARIKAKPATPPRILPGVLASGAIQLPNQWSLRPAGRQVTLGDFPVNIAVHPTGRWLAVLHAGYGTHEVTIFDTEKSRQKIVSRVMMDQAFYGLTFSPDGKTLYASGGEFEVVHAYDFEDGLLFHHRQIPVAAAKEKFVVGGLATDSSGSMLGAAGPWGDAVRLLPVESPSEGVTLRFEKESYPYTCLFDRSSKRVFVSLWNKSSLAIVDLGEKKVVGTWPTENHPTEMVQTSDGKTLYVACSNSTKVSVIDTETGKCRETIVCSLYPQVPVGNTPNSLCLTPDGQLLFVANADSNNLAVFNVANPGETKALGFIPTGWYPTSVRYNPVDKRLYVANGK